MKMVHAGETNEIIQNKMVESIEPNPWSTFINQTGLKNTKLVQEIIRKIQVKYGRTYYKAVMSEIVNKLKDDVKAEKIINDAKKYKNDNEALAKFHTDIKQGEIARHKLAKHYRPLVSPIARHYRKSLKFDDAVQAGELGLLWSIDNFDYNISNNFVKFARKGINGFILNEIRRKTREIRIAGTAQEGISTLNKAKAVLQNKLGREPTTAEIYEETKIPPKKQKKLEQVDNETFVSYLTPSADGDKGILADGNNRSDRVKAESLESLSQAMKVVKLSKIEKYVLNSRYIVGGTNGRVKTYTEIAKKLKISPQGARQADLRAIKKIKEKIENSENSVI